MKRIYVAGFFIALLIGIQTSTALATPYLSGNFGMVMVEDSTLSGAVSGEISLDSGFGFLAAFGNNFDGLRGEGEISYRANDLDKVAVVGYNGPPKGDLSSLALMGNILIDLPLSENIRPFLGAGIGLAQVTVDDRSDSSDDTVFAYQAIAGIGFPLTHITTLDLQYRYFACKNPELNGAETEYQTHNFLAGLRFDF